MLDDKIRHILTNREQKTVLTSNAPLKPAAILLPLFKKGGKYHLLLTKRTEAVEYHKGQICFPGGAQNKGDADLKQTALRETYEEIGVLPEDVEILGMLDKMGTVTSNFLITPFVGIIPYPCQFKINEDEIEELIEIPLSALANKKNYREDTYVIDGVARTGSIFEYKGKTIWGATARILKQFLELIFQENNK
jgi:8-oxo-dGTP pyrophosphatase MutT (NUDIX family)